MHVQQTYVHCVWAQATNVQQPSSQILQRICKEYSLMAMIDAGTAGEQPPDTCRSSTPRRSAALPLPLSLSIESPQLRRRPKKSPTQTLTMSNTSAVCLPKLSIKLPSTVISTQAYILWSRSRLNPFDQKFTLAISNIYVAKGKLRAPNRYTSRSW